MRFSELNTSRDEEKDLSRTTECKREWENKICTINFWTAAASKAFSCSGCAKGSSINDVRVSKVARCHIWTTLKTSRSSQLRTTSNLDFLCPMFLPQPPWGGLTHLTLSTTAGSDYPACENAGLTNNWRGYFVSKGLDDGRHFFRQLTRQYLQLARGYLNGYRRCWWVFLIIPRKTWMTITMVVCMPQKP